MSVWIAVKKHCKGIGEKGILSVSWLYCVSIVFLRYDVSLERKVGQDDTDFLLKE